MEAFLNVIVHTPLQTIGGIILPWFVLLIYHFRMMLCYCHIHQALKTYVFTPTQEINVENYTFYIFCCFTSLFQDIQSVGYAPFFIICNLDPFSYF